MGKTLQRAYVTGIDHYDEVKTGVIFYEDQPHDRIDSHLYIEDLGVDAEKRWYVRGMTNHDGEDFEDYAAAERFLIETAGEDYDFAESYPDLDLSERPLGLLHRYYAIGEGATVDDDGNHPPEVCVVYSSHGLHPNMTQHDYYIHHNGEGTKGTCFTAVISNYDVGADTLEEVEEKMRAEFADEDRGEIWPKFSPLDMSWPTPLPSDDKDDTPQDDMPPSTPLF